MIKKIIDQLTDIYLTKEYWHTTKLSREEANKYHLKMFNDQNIIVVVKDEKLYGYVEFWRINYTQFGRIICGEEILFDEDRLSGNICYLANIWVDKDCPYDVLKVLKKSFFQANSGCEYYVGEARRKKTGLVKVFKRSELKGKLFTLGRM